MTTSPCKEWSGHTLGSCAEEDRRCAKGAMGEGEGGEEDRLTKRMPGSLTRQESTIENVICTANQWKLRLDFKHSCGGNDRGFESTKLKW